LTLMFEELEADATEDELAGHIHRREGVGVHTQANPETQSRTP